jgi:hypothetical protein
VEDKVEKIFSRSDGTLLHVIHRVSDFKARQELVAVDQNLQVASLQLAGSNDFRAHRHISKSVNIKTTIAQESWVVIKGKVKVDYFDLDDTFLDSKELLPGDCSVTLFGGHGYATEGDALVYEFKTGPYLGQEFDKVFIN